MKIKKRKIAAVIKKDCKTRHIYFGKDGATCAVGGLLVAAGIGKKRFFDEGGRNTGGIDTLPESIVSLLYDAYGLNKEDLREIQRTNDCESTTEERREALLAVLKTMQQTTIQTERT